MEDYPEELRTPPVALVCLAGCPDLHQPISAFLHSEQPPINTLALPDFAKASVLARKKQGDPLAPPNQAAPAGILKRDWLLKHRTRVPAVVAVLFRVDQISGDPTQWHQACTDLENLKSVVHGRGTRLVVVLVQTQAGEEVSEDLMIAIRKRAEIESKYLVLFVQNDASELRQSLNRLGSLFGELCTSYYREEGRRIRSRVEKKSAPFPELNIRYCFKVAIFAEFRKDWVEALKFYEEGYRVLREMAAGTMARLPPIQRLVEIKSVAEQLHFKISTLLLHGGKLVDAISWFHKHIRSYKRLVGPVEVEFLHWDWFSRQFLVFAELLETTAATVPPTLSPRFGTSDNPLTEWEFQSAYYYQVAANYLREKRYCLERCSVKNGEKDSKMNVEVPESVMPAVYVGHYSRLFEEGDTVTVLPLSDAEYATYTLAEAERFQESYEIIALYRRAHESFTTHGSARIASQCHIGMAREYYASDDFANAKLLFEAIAGMYRQEGWPTLLWEILGYLRDCSSKLDLTKDFITYSLEMSALPLLSKEEVYRREKIQEEVFEGRHEPVCIEIYPVSPLRMVLVGSVAFHEQSVMPGQPALITVSLLSNLPCAFEIDQLELEFNQKDCNFALVGSRGDQSAIHGGPVQTVPSLEVTPNRWLRLTCQVQSGQSGKLECLTVTAKIKSFLTICCRAECPASLEDLPLWKFEPSQVGSGPTSNPYLSFSGQKIIQVEEPDPLVDLTLSSGGPALVGEIFCVPVTVHPRGHTVHSGELKINLVDARGGGLLMSPRETEQLESHHVELLSISGNRNKETEMETDSIKKIQHSFGVMSVPLLKPGESWSCKLEIKWHRPKSVMLYISLGYIPDNAQDHHRVNVHKSLQIEGKIPLTFNHRFMTPFRKEPLLLSNIKSLSLHEEQKETLALNESNILIVSARNCTEVPLQLVSMMIVPDGTDLNQKLCSVCQVSGVSDKYTRLSPDEEFKSIFMVTPLVSSLDLSVGTVCIEWMRGDTDTDNSSPSESAGTIVTKHKLPGVSVEESPLVVTVECPPFATLGNSFSFYVKVKNLTGLLQEVKYTLGDSQNFVFSGAHNDAAFVLPGSEHVVSYKLVPLTLGTQQVPKITVNSVRYAAAVSTSVTAGTVFVYPNEPRFGPEKGKLELVS